MPLFRVAGTDDRELGQQLFIIYVDELDERAEWNISKSAILMELRVLWRMKRGFEVIWTS